MSTKRDEPTMYLRIAFDVEHWEMGRPVGTKVLEQKWIKADGTEEWRPVPVIETPRPDAQNYM